MNFNFRLNINPRQVGTDSMKARQEIPVERVETKEGYKIMVNTMFNGKYPVTLEQYKTVVDLIDNGMTFAKIKKQTKLTTGQIKWCMMYTSSVR